MKKVVVLYDSVHSYTKKVAMLLTRGLEEGNVYVDCISVQDLDIEELSNYDVIGIGVSNRLFCSKQLKILLSKFKYYNLRNKIGFVFEVITSNTLAGQVAKRIRRDLKKKGLRLIHPIISCIVQDEENPLEDSNSRRIVQIGLCIADIIR
ncbi:MAG: hypothetical protein ACFFBH_08980 [Promethearchaeota archaeon]